MKIFSDKLRDFISGKGGCVEIIIIAYPLIILSASHSIMQFCDRKFLAYNSSMDVAAALPAGILCFTFLSFFMVTVNFTSAIVSQHFGNKDKEACVRAAWSGFYLSLVAAVFIIAVTPWLGLKIIEISGHSKDILDREKLFFLALLPSGAFMCMGAAFFAYFSGQGKTWYAAAINTFSCALNILLDYLMIFGKWGFPAWGITGAGIATSISLLVGFLIIFGIFIFQNQEIHPTRKYLKFSLNDIKKLFMFGSPAGLQVFLEVGAFTVFCFIVGDLGDATLAATTIILAINNLSFLPLLGISDATAIKTGNCIGAGDIETAGKVAFRSWVIVLLYMIFACSLYVLIPDWLIGNFAPEKNGKDFEYILDLGRKILICAAIFNFFDATKFVFMGAMRGAGDTKAILLIGAGLNWLLFVPGIVIMIKFFHAAAISVWIYMTCYIVLESIVFFWRFNHGSWKNINMITRNITEVQESEPINENMPPL